MPRDAAEHLAQRIAALVILNKVKMEETFVKQIVLEKVRGSGPCGCPWLQEEGVVGFGGSAVAVRHSVGSHYYRSWPTSVA